MSQDAFKDNFLVQWQPDTLKSGTIAVERPRVYLHDFESAVQFPKDCPVEKRVLVGLPCGSWNSYGRQSPPEVLSGAPYNPFKVDVWQLGTSLSDMKVTTILYLLTAIRSLTHSYRQPSQRLMHCW